MASVALAVLGCAALATPIAALAATHTIAIDIGHARAGDMRCLPAEVGRCKLDDDAYLVYYEFAPSETVGVRINRLVLSELRLTKDSTDENFSPPSIGSSITDISLTYAWPVRKQVVVRGRAGLAHWEEARMVGGLFNRVVEEQSDGLAPVIGFGVDFGSGRTRVGISADLYPLVGETDYVAYYGIGVRFVFGKPSASTLLALDQLAKSVPDARQRRRIQLEAGMASVRRPLPRVPDAPLPCQLDLERNMAATVERKYPNMQLVR